MALRRPAAASAKHKDIPDDVATFVVPDLSVKELLSCIPCVVFHYTILPCLYSAVPTASSGPQSGPCSTCKCFRQQVFNVSYESTESGILSYWPPSTLLLNLQRSIFTTFITPTQPSITSRTTLSGLSIATLLASWLLGSGSLPTVSQISISFARHPSRCGLIDVFSTECGHQAFSESKFINNTMGWILHSS